MFRPMAFGAEPYHVKGPQIIRMVVMLAIARTGAFVKDVEALFMSFSETCGKYLEMIFSLPFERGFSMRFRIGIVNLVRQFFSTLITIFLHWSMANSAIFTNDY